MKLESLKVNLYIQVIDIVNFILLNIYKFMYVTYYIVLSVQLNSNIAATISNQHFIIIGYIP